MLIISALIYFYLSLIISSTLVNRLNFSKVLIGFFITSYACNVVIFQVLSLLHLVDHAWLVLGFQCILLGVIQIFLFKIGGFTFKLLKEKITGTFKGFNSLDYLLMGLIVFILGLFFFVGITTPPNNQDSLHTHLPRIYYWIQHGSFAFWDATTDSQLVTPINGNIQGLWLFLLGKSENLFFLVQWFSLVVIIACVYEVAKFLSFSPSRALFSGLISLSFPVLLLQTYSFQGDLTVAALMMVSISSLLWTLDQKSLRFFWPSVLATCLAIGTKQTAIFLLPVLVVYILLFLIKKYSWIHALKVLGISIIFFGVFSSYTYIQNLIHTGKVSGNYYAGKSEFAFANNLADKAKYVFPRYLYQSIGVEGLPRYLQKDLIKIKTHLFKEVLIPDRINLESEKYTQPGSSENERFKYDSLPFMNEENAWFGVLALPIILFSLFFSLLSSNKRIKAYAIFTVILSLSYMFLIFLQRPGWDSYQGRYFILAVSPFIPLFSILVPQRRFWRNFFIFTLLPVVVFLSMNIFFTNSSKPIINARMIYGFQSIRILPLPYDSRIQKITKNYLVKLTNRIADSALPLNPIYSLSYLNQVYISDHSNAENLAFINTYIDDAVTLSISIRRDSIEYGLFGKNKVRSLYPVSSSSEVHEGYYLSYSDLAVPLTDQVILVAENSKFKIYKIFP